jgi:hypothetical protein
MDTTRISDLPENMPHFMEPVKVSKPRDENVVSAPTYQPMMDIHPNPYGIPKPATLPNFSGVPPQQNQFDNQPNQQQFEQQQQSFDYPQQMMPSRDYPRDTGFHTQDEQTRVNYIPRPKMTQDFVLENEKANQEKWEDHRSKKHRLSKLDHLINELQTPFLLAILFFIFQLPTFNSLLFRYFSFLSIYSADGSPNSYGFIFKSALFGFFYYAFIKSMDYFSD